MTAPAPLVVTTAPARSLDSAPASAWPLLWPPLRMAMHAIDAERAHGAAVSTK